jgi:hypothetical protein
MGQTERNKRKANRKKLRRLEAYDNHNMAKLYEEAKIDDDTWDGVTKKELVSDPPSQKESSWWSYFGW